MPIIYTSSDEPTEALASAISKGLDEHNLSVAPSLSEVKSLAASAEDEGGRVVGGALGRTWGLCCELLELWVDTEFRNLGIGSGLLIKFESHARQRGCKSFYLTTLSYQAPEFYKKHGYEAIASISGYPDGITKYLMFKTEA